MTLPIISVQNLSKAYRLGCKEQTPDTLVGAAKSLATAPYRNFRELSRLNTFKEDGPQGDEQTLWALRNVSFDVAEGEVVGIIGRNGAGKSTLLKILSRITEPTAGRAVIRGRVSSLLEVGTGFHPELSGRDNIYMNGTILGMTKREIDRKFDEIVGFSGVEKFLDTPTKRYSSGMQVRLAFAVAAHLEPEVLIIDEVLAVGDSEFQSKCLGKMKDVASCGRTVLLVSHNVALVRSMAKTAILLDGGAVIHQGSTNEALDLYRDRVSRSTSVAIAERKDRGGTGKVRIGGLCIESGERGELEMESGMPFQIRVRVTDVAVGMWCMLSLYDRHSNQLANFTSQIQPTCDTVNRACDREFVCRVSGAPIRPGEYYLNAAVGRGDETYDHVAAASIMRVLPSPAMPFDESLMPGTGCLWVPHTWQTP